MKKVKRLGERLPFRLISDPKDNVMWFDLWGNSYVTFTRSEVETLRDTLDLVLSLTSRRKP